MRDNLLATRVRGLGGTEAAAKSRIYGQPLLIKGATELKAKSFKHDMIEMLSDTLFNHHLPEGQEPIAEVTEIIDRGDPRVRLRTTMRLYWDAARYTVGGPYGGAIVPTGDWQQQWRSRRAPAAATGPSWPSFPSSAS